MNILISGWPGAGSSTAAKILALTLNMQYLYGGGVLKRWAELMGYNPKTNELNSWILKYGKYWDDLWEKYLLSKADKLDNTIIDSKISGFFIDKPEKVIEIFIIASLDARMSRAAGDKRKEEIRERDEILQKTWEKKYNINIFDQKELSAKYNYVVDTSNIGIQAVARRLLEIVSKKQPDQFQLDTYKKRLNAIYHSFFQNSDYLNDALREKKLYISPDKILEDLQSGDYADISSHLPPEMSKI